jgi:glycosyltransferase involved in cell wall biosynthesis
LVSVGRFVKEKNYLNLIKHLDECQTEFKLTLIGGGPLKSTYTDYIDEKKLHENVILIDWIDQKSLIDIIIDCDIYIQYSISEGMPRSILEAMALGMPVITTNVGSIAGVVRDKQNGLVLDDFSPQCLQSAINTFRSPAFAIAMAGNAFDDIEKKYEWSKVFKLYRESILNGNTTR